MVGEPCKDAGKYYYKQCAEERALPAYIQTTSFPVGDPGPLEELVETVEINAMSLL